MAAKSFSELLAKAASNDKESKALAGKIKNNIEKQKKMEQALEQMRDSVRNSEINQALKKAPGVNSNHQTNKRAPDEDSSLSTSFKRRQPLSAREAAEKRTKFEQERAQKKNTAITFADLMKISEGNHSKVEKPVNTTKPRPSKTIPPLSQPPPPKNLKPSTSGPHIQKAASCRLPDTSSTRSPYSSGNRTDLTKRRCMIERTNDRSSNVRSRTNTYSNADFVRKEIKSIFGRCSTDYENNNDEESDSEDDDDMEATSMDIFREERLSLKAAKLEDEEEERYRRSKQSAKNYIGIK